MLKIATVSLDQQEKEFKTAPPHTFAYKLDRLPVKHEDWTHLLFCFVPAAQLLI